MCILHILGYHSVCHIDNDVNNSIISVLHEGINDDDVIYYFVFPEYNLKIPLRNGDVLVFNPLVYHSCSDAIHKNAMIFSQYSSRKTFASRSSCLNL